MSKDRSGHVYQHLKTGAWMARITFTESHGKRQEIATGGKKKTSMADIAEGYRSFWVFVVPFGGAVAGQVRGASDDYAPGRGQWVFDLPWAIVASGSVGANSCPIWPIKSSAAGRHILQTSDDGFGRKECKALGKNAHQMANAIG